MGTLGARAVPSQLPSQLAPPQLAPPQLAPSQLAPSQSISMIARVHYHFHYHFHYRYHYENIDLYCSSGNLTLVLAESPQLQIAN